MLAARGLTAWGPSATVTWRLAAGRPSAHIAWRMPAGGPAAGTSRPTGRRSRRASGRTSRAGARRRWRRVMRPARLIVIPGPPTVIVAPVRANRKRDDWQTDHRAVVQHRHGAALIRVANTAS